MNSQWSMCSESLNVSDRRMVIGSGPFRMIPGAINQLSFAVIYQPNVPHPCPDISGLADIADQVQTFFDENIVTSVDLQKNTQVGSAIIPNPFRDQTQLILNRDDDRLEQVQLFSVTGQQVRNYSGLNSDRLVIKKDNLTPGMYLYKGLTKNQKVCSGKLIVQ